MSALNPAPRPPEFDGLVIEDEQGVRLLSLPAAVVPALRSAAVIRYRIGESVYNMRVRDGRFTQARDEMAPRIEQAPATPSPTPPPAPEEEEEAADIPIRVWRGGQWVVTHVTREQYERYQSEGKISTDAPHHPEGTDQ